MNAGYLTVKDGDDGKEEYTLVIPNGEVRREFRSLTYDYLGSTEIKVNAVARDIREGKPDSFLKDYRNMLLKSSYYDFKSENSYHMFLLGMTVSLEGEYEILSNRENGKGRPGIVLKAKENRYPSYVIEFKFTKDEKEDLNELANTGMDQMKDKAYAHGLSGTVHLVSLAHRGKDVEMHWESME